MLAALVAWKVGLQPQGPINVILIGIDTVRSDHLGCYGYPRPTSPRLDALARDSVVFEQAISQSSWTLPAFASILTGVLPQRHGAGQGKDCLLRPCGSLAPGQPTLAELFAKAGYRTASFVSNGFVGPGSGLERGFEQTDLSVSGAIAVDHAMPWLEQHRAERVFVFVHVIEPHMPYAPPPADAAPFLDSTYDGPIGTSFDYRKMPECRTEADRRRVIDLYDGDIRTTDRLIGRILDELERLDMDRRSLIAVVSDHGEELFERGHTGHGHSMYEELLHVPLLLRFPRATRCGRVRQQVRTMDLFPTLLEAAGVPVPAGIDGVGLLGLARGAERPPATATAIAEFTFSGPELRGLRSDHDKLVLDADRGTAALFDLDADPAERTDVAAERAERVAAMRAVLMANDAASKPGFHVFVRAGWQAGRVQVVLMTVSSGFGNLDLRYTKTGDGVTVSPDRRVATVTFALGASGENGVRVEMRDSGASMTVASVTLDGKPLPGVPLAVGEGPPNATLPRVITPAQAAVRRAGPPPFSRSLVLAVQSVSALATPPLALDPETAERLRSLGYVQ